MVAAMPITLNDLALAVRGRVLGSIGSIHLNPADMRVLLERADAPTNSSPGIFFDNIQVVADATVPVGLVMTVPPDGHVSTSWVGLFKVRHTTAGTSSTEAITLSTPYGTHTYQPSLAPPLPARPPPPIPTFWERIGRGRRD